MRKKKAVIILENVVRKQELENFVITEKSREKGGEEGKEKKIFTQID